MTTVNIAEAPIKTAETEPLAQEDIEYFLSLLGTLSNRKIKRLARASIIESHGAFVRDRYDGLVGNLIRWRDGLHSRGR